MQIQINPGDGVHHSDALEQHIKESLGVLEKRFGDRLTRLEIHMSDINGPKGGVNKEVRIEARPNGLAPVMASATEDDVYDAARTAISKLEKVLSTRFGKLDDRR